MQNSAMFILSCLCMKWLLLTHIVYMPLTLNLQNWMHLMIMLEACTVDETTSLHWSSLSDHQGHLLHSQLLGPFSQSFFGTRWKSLSRTSFQVGMTCKSTETKQGCKYVRSYSTTEQGQERKTRRLPYICKKYTADVMYGTLLVFFSAIVL